MEIYINRKTREVDLSKTKKTIGNDMENLQETLEFFFNDEFVYGEARLEYVINGIKNYTPIARNEESYSLPVKNVITKAGRITMQLVISEPGEEEPSFRSNEFYLYCGESINAVNEAPEGYELWIENANQKLLQFASAIEEIERLNITASKDGKVVTITINKKDGTTSTETISDGASFMYQWQGTSLGVKTDLESEYQYVNLKGDKGDKGDAGAIKMVIVNELPETGQDDTIYLVPLENPDIQGNNYAEYVWINGAWELLGKIGVQVDLTNYYTKQETYNKNEVDDLLNGKANTSDIPTKTSDLTNDSDFANKQYVEDYFNSRDGNGVSY